MGIERFVSRKTFFTGHILTLRVDDVELENGNPAKREVVHTNSNAVCVAALTEKNEVYMVKQFRYPFARELWELPAGKIDAGEEPLEAAKRELREEAGVAAAEYFYLGELYPTVAYSDEVIHCYAARGLAIGVAEPDEDEFISAAPVSLERLREMLDKNELEDAKTQVLLLRLMLALDNGTLEEKRCEG